MNRKLMLILGIICFSLILISFINSPIIDKEYNENKTIDKSNYSIEDIGEEEKIDTKEELKTANLEASQEYDFSFNTNITESWNSTFHFLDQRSNYWMMQIQGTEGYNVSFNIYIKDLVNNTTGEPMNLSDLPFENRTLVYLKRGGGYGFIPIPINGQLSSTDSFSLTLGVSFYFYTGQQTTYDLKYNATLFLNETRERSITTSFIPDSENTDSFDINWELKYSNSFIFGNYSAILEIENFTDFSLENVKGKYLNSWKSLDFIETVSGLTFNGSYEEYIIELTTKNKIIINYNENLTLPFRPNIFYPYIPPDDNELNLNVKCLMAGNLTIIFKNSTNGITRLSQMVSINEFVDFNYVMYNSTPGGLGSLEISLITPTDNINFGYKLVEIIFQKNAIIGGLTQNTTAFTDFFVIAGYLDNDYLIELSESNSTGAIDINETVLLNLVMIKDATLSYNLDPLNGQLNFSTVPGIEFGIYNAIIDLKKYKIVPDLYNLTINGYKTGYTPKTTNFPFLISKKDVAMTYTLTPADGVLTIEETFALDINFLIPVPYPPWYETFLLDPVNITIDVLKDGELNDIIPLYNVVQSPTIQGPIGNDSLPGEYILNITIISKYYQGNFSINVTIVKKPLLLSFSYDEDDVEEDEEFDISWNFGSGNYNTENMSVEIYVDNKLHQTIDISSNPSGVTKLELDEGEHKIYYVLISPFYSGSGSFTIDVEGEEKPELTWIEENWLWVVIGIIIIIALAALAIFMLISKHKLSAKRELESELITLKNRMVSTEDATTLINEQIAQIASIYWILVIHSDQGIAMVEIEKFKFDEVLSEEQQKLIGEGFYKDSALIGGFLSAIRNFSRETTGTSLEYQPIFNSETDYSTTIENKEIHRRILEGTQYFMAFVSSKSTDKISEILGEINSIFRDNYGKTAEKFDGAVKVFNPFKNQIVSYLHDEIKKLQNQLEDQQMLLEHYSKHLTQVQDKIGIKKKSIQK